MSALALIGAVVAAEPTVSGAWRHGVVRLTVEPPAGEHLNDDGPMSGWLEVDGVRLEVGGTGATLGAGLTVAAARGAALSGSLSVPLCEDDGGSCRTVPVTFRGTPARRAAALAATSPPPPPAAAPHADSVEAAMATAAETGRLVLLDFGAVWCPPCNLLSAEVLEDPDDAAALAGFVLVAVDVDDPASWTAKDRYDVGGYPTLIIARPDGAEIDRMVGYPGEPETLAWLAAAPTAPPLSALPPPSPSPQAASIALRLARQGDTEAAAAWLAVAEGDQDADLRLARLSLQPAAEDVRWLIAHDAPIAEWVWDALGLCESDAVLAGEVLGAIRRSLPDASPVLAADLLWAAAELTDPAAAPTLYAAGAAALRAGLSGEPERDRGHWTFLAQLLERAGDAEAGIAVLAEGARHYPEEFTFHYAAAGLQQRAGLLDDALTSIDAAVAFSYGDNALRAATRKAEILAARGQTDAALALIDATLAAAPRPNADLKVRTPRYLAALETLRAELSEK